MTAQLTVESPLWGRVLAIAEAIDEPGVSIEHIRLLLCGIEEGFAGNFDPAEAFPEFAAHRLCRSLAQLLTRLGAEPVP